jgi:uncharacterized protein
MKRLTFAFLVAVVALTAAAPAQTIAPTEISVSGTGSVTLPPNVANVSASVTTNAANAGEAVGQNNTIYDRIVAALAKLGIARADITLAAYNVNYNPRPQGSPQPGETYGYTVARDFSVKVREIAKAGSVVDACTSAGATSIGGVAFGLADDNAARAQATAKAVANARAAAEALVAAAHLHITGVKSIGMAGGGGIAPMAKMALMSAAPGAMPPTQFDNSNVSVTATVDLVFLASP